MFWYYIESAHATSILLSLEIMLKSDDAFLHRQNIENDQSSILSLLTDSTETRRLGGVGSGGGTIPLVDRQSTPGMTIRISRSLVLAGFKSFVSTFAHLSTSPDDRCK